MFEVNKRADGIGWSKPVLSIVSGSDLYVTGEVNELLEDRFYHVLAVSAAAHVFGDDFAVTILWQSRILPEDQDS
jgi:hypothetical protein